MKKIFNEIRCVLSFPRRQESKIKFNILGLVLILLFFSINNSYGETSKKERFIQFALGRYENDSVYGPDRYYSNGLQLLFLTKNYGVSSDNNSFHNYSFGLGQNIYTPHDIETKVLDLNDRPYAGYLYAFLSKNIRHGGNKTDTFGISLGVTGEASLGEKVQTKIHEMIGSPDPEGWDNQLSNEPLFMLYWARAIELNERKPYEYGWNLIPKFSANLGTPFTNASAGIEYRFGWNLDDDLITNRIKTTSMGAIRPTKTSSNFKNFSYYFFVEATGDVILYDTFLDGNISGYRPHISKNWFRYEFDAGITVRLNRLYVKYSTAYLSKEFKEQEDTQVIFSITAGYFF